MDLETQKIKIEELEKRLNAMSKKLSANTEAISSNSQAIISNTQAISDFSSTISSLGGNSIQSTFDCFTFKQKRKAVSEISFDPIFFVCDPNTLVRIRLRVDVFFEASTNLSPTFSVFLNTYGTSADAIYTETFGTISENFSKTIIVEHSFIASTENNMFRFKISSGTSTVGEGACGVTFYDACVFGTNVEILNRRNDFKVFLTDSYYYLTRNTEDKCQFSRQFRTVCSLTSSFTNLTNIIPENATYNNILQTYNFTYIPSFYYNQNSSSYVISGPDRFYFCCEITYPVRVGEKNPTPSSTIRSVTSYGPQYTCAHPIGPLYSNAFDNIGTITTRSDCYPAYALTNPATYHTTGKFSINGRVLNQRFVDNCVVFAKDWQTRCSERPNYYLLTNTLGEVYFYPSINGTVALYVGKGHQVSAYMQSDLSINVYMCWQRKIYKYILIYNSTNQSYEVSDNVTVIDNAIEYLEGYSTDRFVNECGTWKIYR